MLQMKHFPCIVACFCCILTSSVKRRTHSHTEKHGWQGGLGKGMGIVRWFQWIEHIILL